MRPDLDCNESGGFGGRKRAERFPTDGAAFPRRVQLADVIDDGECGTATAAGSCTPCHARQPRRCVNASRCAAHAARLGLVSRGLWVGASPATGFLGLCGVRVAVHLQTALRSPSVAMAAFSLQGMAPPYVTRNQLYNGRDPLLAMPLVALFLTWSGPAMKLWLPRALDGDSSQRRSSVCDGFWRRAGAWSWSCWGC